MERGIFYITEAVTALLLMALVIAAVSLGAVEKPEEKVNDLYITQRLHDLLKYRFVERMWLPGMAVEGFPMLPAMAADFGVLFPGKSGFVEVNGAMVEIGNGSGESISVSAVFYSALMERSELRALVYLG